MNILFDINNQTLLRIDKEPLVSGSQNYVKALFTFSDEWTDCAKTCSFIKGNKTYNQVLDGNNSCYVPAEVLEKSGEFYVALLGTKGSTSTRITTNGVWVTVKQSGFKDGEEPAEIIPALVDAVKDFTSDVSSLTGDVNLPNTFPTSIKTIYKSLVEQLNTALDKIGAKYYLVGDRKVKAEFEYSTSYYPEIYGYEIADTCKNLIRIGLIEDQTYAASMTLDGGNTFSITWKDGYGSCNWYIDATPYRGQVLEIGFASTSAPDSAHLIMYNGTETWEQAKRTDINSKTYTTSIFNRGKYNHCGTFTVPEDATTLRIGIWGYGITTDKTYTFTGVYLTSLSRINWLRLSGIINCNFTDIEE